MVKIFDDFFKQRKKYFFKRMKIFDFQRTWKSFGFPVSRKFSISEDPENSLNFQGKINNIKKEINGYLNTDFDDSREIVIRKSDFRSGRTLVINADKAAFELNEEFKLLLKNPNTKIDIVLN